MKNPVNPIIQAREIAMPLQARRHHPAQDRIRRRHHHRDAQPE